MQPWQVLRFLQVLYVPVYEYVDDDTNRLQSSSSEPSDQRANSTDPFVDVEPQTGAADRLDPFPAKRADRPDEDRARCWSLEQEFEPRCVHLGYEREWWATLAVPGPKSVAAARPQIGSSLYYPPAITSPPAPAERKLAARPNDKNGFLITPAPEIDRSSTFSALPGEVEACAAQQEAIRVAGDLFGTQAIVWDRSPAARKLATDMTAHRITVVRAESEQHFLGVIRLEDVGGNNSLAGAAAVGGRSFETLAAEYHHALDQAYRAREERPRRFYVHYFEVLMALTYHAFKWRESEEYRHRLVQFLRDPGL